MAAGLPTLLDLAVGCAVHTLMPAGRGYAKAELGIKALDTTMGLRVAYVDALGAGLTAAETADAQARAEVQALVAEACAILA